MSLENSWVIDATGIEVASETVVLTIVDSWGWDDELGHLLALQEKLNAYFEFVESGQILEEYPESLGRSLRIDIIGRFPLPLAAQPFLEKAAAAASELGISIDHRVVLTS